MPKKAVKLRWTPALRKQSAKTEKGIREAMAKKLAPRKAKPKSKVVHESGEWTIERNEAFQREFSIFKGGQPAIPSVRFSTKLEAEKVLRALTGEAFKNPDDESPPPKEVPNRPEFHESAQAVRGQTPRA
jgi:hypothetical protein